ncbi:MAG: hypothetical protein DHS20C02_19580 [Micavibrio sp.]|nr:MAG: hypothetical protein DHS20C02_19580 [Micavibrio sp.]
MAKQEQNISIFTAMSGTGRRLRRWEKEKLLSHDQLLAILDFEKHNQGKRFFRSLISLALFAIAVGILSIVAANWAHIPGSAKIGLHFILNIAAAVTIWRAAGANNKIWREGATLLFFALSMTLIALIGQVFQLDGNYAGALSLWLVISSPAVFMYGKTAINAVPWVAGLLATIACVLFEAVQFFDEDLTSFLLCLGAGLYVPLLLMVAGVSRRIREHRVDWSYTFFRTSMFVLAIQGTLGSFLWYVGVGGELDDVLETAGSIGLGYGLMFGVIALAPIGVYIFESFKRRQGQKIMDRSAIIFVIGSIVSATLPLVLMAGEIDFIAAVHFVAYWCFAGWIGNRMGFNQLVSASITLVTLRIMVVYCELFGGLMLTGFGLIFSGILMLVILKVAVTLKKKITA